MHLTIHVLIIINIIYLFVWLFMTNNYGLLNMKTVNNAHVLKLTSAGFVLVKVYL